MVNLLEGLITDAQNECETSTENIQALNEIKIQHERMLKEFKVKRNKTKKNLYFLIKIGTS